MTGVLCGALVIVGGATSVVLFVLLREKRKKIVLSWASFALCILLLELTLWLIYPQTMENGQMFEYDARLGWTFRENERGHILYRGEANHYIQTNAMGFRDGSPELADTARTIMVLGRLIREQSRGS